MSDAAPGLSDSARSLRLVTRLILAGATVGFVLAFAASKDWLPHGLGRPALVFGFGAALLGAWLGLRTRRQALADRDRQSALAMSVAITARLGHQDDATLQRIAAQSGPAARAAARLLAARRREAATRPMESRR